MTARDSDENRLTRRGPDNRAWYVVATAAGEAEAAIIAGLLKSAEIPVWTYFESAGRAIGLGVGMLGAVEVMVPPEYYDEAMDLLEGVDDEDLITDGTAALEDDPNTIDGQATPVDDEDDLA